MDYICINRYKNQDTRHKIYASFILSIIGVQDKPSDHESCYCQDGGSEKGKLR